MSALTTLFVPLLKAVLAASWQGSLAIALVLLARRALGARVPARWRYALWSLVLLRLLVPAFVLPHSPASLANLPAVAHPFALGRELPMRVGNDLPTLPGRDPAPGGRAAPVPMPPAAAAVRPAWSAWEWGALVWGLGVAGMAGSLLACAGQMRGRLRRSVSGVDAATEEIWRACCRRWLRRPPPRLWAADWVQSPALVGLFRPVLVVPRSALGSFSAQDWEHVFAHEIAHLRARDHWGQFLQLAALCVHWFNPLVWAGFRRLRADRELAADEWALRRLEGERALAYGQTLLKALAGPSGASGIPFRPGMVVGISEDGAQMTQRLRRITAFPARRHLLGSVIGFAVVVLLAALVLGQGTVPPEPTPAGSPKMPAPPAPSPAAGSVLATAQHLLDGILAAARAGDSAEVARLIEASYTQSPPLGADGAGSLLEDLVRRRELKAFTTLLDPLRQTNLGKDWKLNDELLLALVKDRRTDFLDALLARRFDLDRLRAQVVAADQPTAAWITRRVTEVAKERADVDALGKAAGDGDLDTIRRLLDAGVNVNGVGGDDNTPLIRAVFTNRLDAAQLLLDRGALVDKPRFPGWDYTPLCLVNSVPMAELLHRAGADVHAKLYGRDVSILSYAVMHSPPEVVAWFLAQGLDPKMLKDNSNLLFGLENARTAELLLAAGADPNQVNETGRTPICSARSKEVAQKLIEHGAKLTGLKEPLLPRMIQFGSPGAVEAVLQAPTPPDHDEVQTALMSAAFMDRADIAQVLLRYGAKPNEPALWFGSPKEKMLPLMACAINPSDKVAQLLVDAGADPNAGEQPGEILRNAIGNGLKEVSAILLKAGARGVDELVGAITSQDQAKIKQLLDAAPTYAENPVFWNGALVAAARQGDVPTVRTLLGKGVPPGGDAANEAIRKGYPEVLAVFLEQRSLAGAPRELGSLLYNAAHMSRPYLYRRPAADFERSVELLLAAGAPVRGDGTNPPMAGAAYTESPGGNLKVVRLLTQAGADPNPPMKTGAGADTHLLDVIQESVAKGDRFGPSAEVIAELNRLAAPAGKPPVPPAAPREVGPSPAPKPPEATPTPAEIPDTLFKIPVAAEDGAPVGDGSTMLYDHVVFGPGAGASSMRGSARVETDGIAALWVRLGAQTVSLAVVREGYAAAYAGPFTPPTREQLDAVRFTLTRGFRAAIEVVDAAGRPITGTRLKAYYPGPPETDLVETTTDGAGTAILDRVGTSPLNVRLRADGYESDEITAAALDPARPLRWTLKPTTPLPGTVTAAGTAQPIAGARIKLAGVRGPHEETYSDPAKAPLLTTSDAQGRFTLASLRPDSRYFVFVEASGHGGVLLGEVRSGQPDLKVSLGPELFVRGKVIHITPAALRGGKLRVFYSQTFKIGDGSFATGQQLAMDPKDGETSFALGPFYAEPVDISAGNQKIRLQAARLPEPNLVLDLAADPK